VKSNSHHILKNGHHSKKQSGHSQWIRIESRARLISLAVAAGGIFGSDGACYITIFTGQEPETRARDYYDAIERGVIGTRVADAQVGSRGGATRLANSGERPARKRRLKSGI
jgi:hypothetical protein